MMPIRMQPIAAERQVAAATAGTGIPASLRMSGFTNTMYAMVRKVVAPARISVRQEDPRSSMWNIRSKNPSVPVLDPGIVVLMVCPRSLARQVILIAVPIRNNLRDDNIAHAVGGFKCRQIGAIFVSRTGGQAFRWG